MSTVLIVISWAIVALTTVIAIGLARVAIRERSVPEGLMASFFIAGGPLGYGVLMLRSTFEMSAEAFAPFQAFAQTAFLVPLVAVVLFTWQVFRPDASWAKSLAVAISFLMVVIVALGTWFVQPLGLEDSVARGGALFWMGIATRSIGFGWACAEATLFYAKARRRTAIGLGDALVTNRFLLWSVWSGAALAMVVLRSISAMIVDSTVAQPVMPLWLRLGMMIAGASTAGAVWLTFAPPSFYRRWVVGPDATA